MAEVPFLPNRKVSFAANGMIPSPGRNSEIRKQKCEVETTTHTEVQRNEQDNNDDVPLVDSIDKRDRELTEGQTKSNDGEGENAENVQPSTSVKENFTPTEITMKIKERSQRIKFEQADEESELPVRAISTPEHNVGELTFGLGDDMSAIESTPTRKRSKRQLRQPCVPPIEEADNENE
ncbi:hypothetical protein WUBG_06512 [Wuchereria bancrofti]|uniref:Uncharacterized protein n=2 Tax=Wuchereria bancrofti TaxID=6293 RepID=J9EK90_WUCBA|nr:hypothetical protein WUBG_06512 [Wuchereria bancrofti]